MPDHTRALSFSSMKKKLVAYLLLLIPFYKVEAQNVDFAKQVVEDLCGDEMAGRGYVNRGVQKAASYIDSIYKQNQLLAFGTGYLQSFGYPAVAYPDRVEVTMDEDLELVVGEDFIISAGCPSVKGKFNLLFVDSEMVDNPQLFKEFERTAFYKTFLVVDAIQGKKMNNQAAATAILSNNYKAKGLIFANQSKLTWSASLDYDAYPTIYILKGKIKRFHSSIQLLIESERNDYNVSNVIGYVKGKKYPDSFVVITAHYDHLGMLGHYAKFPGANDNASGVAMMLDLMQTIRKKPLEYSVAFMAFAGEEIGLLGSLYYTEKPLFPLNQISLLINLDLMGTGDKGMTVVNATEFPKEFQDLQLLNISNDYLTTVNSRGKAANSDHYYFTEKGVKSFFFYLMGEYQFYHDIGDTPKALTFSRYNPSFTLIHQFLLEYTHSE